MFVQVIRGKVTDPQGLRSLMDRWVAELSTDAPGWLGSTAGVTDSGEFIAIARFNSEEEARRNSSRPEQDVWWKEAEQHFTGGARFQDSTEVDIDLSGDPDRAGFVQVICGRSRDPQKARDLMNDSPQEFAAFRPDILGSVAVHHEGGEYTLAIYFTSEAEARVGEKKEMPDALKAQMEAMDALEIGEPEFLDLKDPWLYAPR